MNTIHQKRNFVSNLYPKSVWKARVAQMSDEQVIAIYLRAKEDGQEPKKESVESEFHQETLF